MNIKRLFRALALAMALLLAFGGAALADMRRGDRGDAVAALQRRLIEMGWLNDVADGMFGKNTERAVAAFQQAAGLPVTGVADSATLERLEPAPTLEPSAVPDAPVETAAPVSATEAFAGLKVMEGCGWVDDEESAGYALGRNAAGEEIVYGVSLVNRGAPESMTLEAVSWTGDVSSDSTDMLECWEEALAGHTCARLSRHTEISSDGNVYPVSTVDVFLPDDPSIAGEQTVTVALDDHRASVQILLTYDGGYESGSGWKLDFLGTTLSDAVH